MNFTFLVFAIMGIFSVPLYALFSSSTDAQYEPYMRSDMVDMLPDYCDKQVAIIRGPMKSYEDLRKKVRDPTVCKKQ